MPIDFEVFVKETIRHHLETLVRIQQKIHRMHLPLVMTRHDIGYANERDNLISQFRDLYDYLHSLGVLPEYQEYVDFYLNERKRIEQAEREMKEQYGPDDPIPINVYFECEERNFFETLGLEEEYGFKMPNTNGFMPEAKMKKEV